MSLRLFALTAAAGLLVSGCDLAPPAGRPDTAIPPAFKEAAGWQQAQPADDVPRGKWWAIFNDPILDGLEQQVTSANQDLKAAMARLDQARDASDYARAAYFPAVNANAAASRQKISSTIANPRPVPRYSDLQLGATASYELDLWGRIRNTVRASSRRAEASAGDLASLDLSLHAELASDYFGLRADDTKQRILNDAVAAYDRALALTSRLYNGGAATKSDVAQAQTQLETAKTAAADNRLQRAQLEHAVAILTGVPPANFGLDAADIGGALPTVNLTVPGTLLERRPDIAAAERRVQAANADIGVARAAFFPVFSLSGFFGVESAAPATLFNAPSQAWSAGGSVAGALFDAGQREAATAEARAAYDESVADYRGSVLSAYREVEDNLAALRQLAEEAATEDRAVAAAQIALDQANYRYKGGITTYLEVVTAQNAALQARLSAADITARRLNATVSLVKALGGGWDQDLGEKPPKSSGAS